MLKTFNFYYVCRYFACMYFHTPPSRDMALCHVCPACEALGPILTPKQKVYVWTFCVSSNNFFIGDTMYQEIICIFCSTLELTPPFSLAFQVAGITDMCHHGWLLSIVFNCFNGLSEFKRFTLNDYLLWVPNPWPCLYYPLNINSV